MRIRSLAFGICALVVASAPSLIDAQTLTYDPQGRLSTATYPDGTGITYTYDSAGNRTQYTVTGAIPPTAGAVSYGAATNSANNPIPLSLSGSPANGVSVSTGPSHGSATAVGLRILYTPTSGYAGSDSFQYTAWNPSGVSSPATVSITVAAGSIWGSFTWGPPSQWIFSVTTLPPIANNISPSVNENSSSNPITLNITGGAPTGVAVSTVALHGTASASGTSITYTPTPSYSGADSFAYTASNAGGTSSPATASITVVAFTPVTHTYTSGSLATETVPTGAGHVTITVDGGGGGGSCGSPGLGGTGGGGSAEAIITTAVTGGNTLTYTVGGGGAASTSCSFGTAAAGGNSTVSGTVSGGSLSLIGGGGGGASGGGGAGGTASGGSTNTSGGAGSSSNTGGTAASGATAGNPPGGGGSGNARGANPGAGGQVKFYYYG